MESLEDASLVLSLQRPRPRTFFPFLPIFGLVFLQFHPCLSGDTISTGHSITGNQTITSKGGIFELGYFSLGSPARYYIGIWYKDVTIDNVVWVANRDMPLQNDTAELKISEDGTNLVLQSKSGSLIWSTNLTPTSSSHLARVAAVLQDNGNLVLRDGNSSGATMWESFDHPTDTFLPGGRLGWNNVTKEYVAITSWKSREDPSSGLYSQKINPNGELELPLYWNNTLLYWTTGVWNGQFFAGIPEMRTVSLYYSSNFTKDDNGSYYTYWLHVGSMIKTKIDVNGQIKQAIWNKATGSWNVFWLRPNDQCDVYGICGAFGFCIEQPNQNTCDCLDGFEPVSDNDWESNVWSGGCVRKKKLQCESDDFSRASLKSPTNLSASVMISGDAESCRSACLRNCSCTAYSYEFGKCSTWKEDLLNLVQGTSDGSAARILVRIATGSGKSGGGKKLSQSVIIKIAVAVALLVILLAAAGTARYFWKSKAKKAGVRKRGHASAMFEEANKENVGPELPFYRLRDIMAATDNFSESNKLGQGGFGPVYRVYYHSLTPTYGSGCSPSTSSAS